MADFVHLHLHTVYSLLDGATRIDKLISRAKEMGQTAVAITDHGVMFGVIDFYKEAKKQGVKPIIGCEVYVAPRSMQDKESGIDSERYHLILLAKNNIGYKNLIKLVSLGYTEGFYYKPRIDHATLEKYSEGIIALSACFKGEIPQAILNDDNKKAIELAKWYANVFGKENFFLEIQDHGMEDDIKIIDEMVKISKELDLGLVATNDVHYLDRADSEIQDILMCIQMGKSVSDTDRMKFSTDELYFKSSEEMSELFKEYPQAIENTHKIADMCDVEIEFGKLQLPKFEVEKGKTPFDVLKDLCYENLDKKYDKKVRNEVLKQLEYELGTINKMGYVDYFLIVWDFVKFAKENGIAVGPGRGSAAGSVVSYLLDITTVEPMQYGLLFERFLNPERISMPDIDIDFCQLRRHEVIEYVSDKYGKDHVAQIATFGTLGARAAIRDVGRVLDVPYAECDKIAKMVPFEININLRAAMERNHDLKVEYDNNAQIHKLIDNAIALEGVPRHVSTHAAGVVITEKPTDEYVPMIVGETGIATQWTMGILEELGLLKMDFLGLKTLTVIQTALSMIKEDSSHFFDNFNDKETYELFSRGDTDGVFQFESPGMKAFLKELKPDCFEDIIAAGALYRPGPMESIPKYVEGKHGGEITYAHPKLEKILDVTYGCIVYQEQVMQIVQELAGYTLGQADILRRAMGKKKHDVMRAERKKFVDGCVKNNIEKRIAEGIFDEMMSFASYAFNKSHAAAYAVISYETAYLKAHYPCEFLAALLCTETDNTAKITKYIAEARNLGIEIAPCDVNESGENFTPIDNKIRFGLVAIKGLGYGVVGNILAERNKNGKFKSFYDFCKRMIDYDINKRTIEGLIKSGAFDGLAKRAQLIAVYEQILSDLQKAKKNQVSGQFSMFEDNVSNEESEPSLPDIPEFPFNKLLELERESTGIFMSGSPLDEYKSMLKNIKKIDIEELLAENSKIKDESFVTVVGVLQSIKKKNTKNGAAMAFADIADQTGSVEIVLFPKVLMDSGSEIGDGNVVILKGRAQIKEDVPPTIVVNSVQKLTREAFKKIYIKISNDDVLEKLVPILKLFHGENPVYIHNSETNVTMLASEDMWVSFCDALAKEIEDLGCEIVVK